LSVRMSCIGATSRAGRYSASAAGLTIEVGELFQNCSENQSGQGDESQDRDKPKQSEH
jgi:hypothetical protein